LIINHVILISIILIFTTPNFLWGSKDYFFHKKSYPNYLYSNGNYHRDKSNNIYFESDTIISQSERDTSFENKISQTDIEEAYFFLVYQDVVRTRIVIFNYNNSFYLPLIEIFKLLEINFNFSQNQKLISGFFIEADSTYSFDFVKRIYQDKSKQIYYSNDDFIYTPLEIYVKPELIEKSLGLSFSFNINELTINLKTEKILPVYSRIKREINYKYIKKEIIKPDFTYPIEKKLIKGLFLDYFISSNFTKGLPAFHNYNLGLGGIFLGGDIELSMNGSINQKFTSINDYIYKWNYVFNYKHLSQISLGTLEYNGLQQTTISGISITNEPVEPRKNYYVYSFSDQCGPNWTVELYINNKLTDVTKADANGSFHFDIPLNYGTSFISLKFYGPAGNYLSTRKLFQIPVKFIPPKEFNYTINIGKVNYNNNFLAQAYGSYGFSEWLTNSVGLEFIKGDNLRNIFLYNELNARINSSYIFNLTLAPKAYYRLGLNALYYSQMSINLFATKFFKNTFYNPYNINEEFQSDLFIPFDFGSYSINLGSGFKIQNSAEFRNKFFSFNAGVRTEYVNPTISYKIYYNKYNKYLFKQSYLTYGLIFPLRFLDKWSNLLKANLLNIQFNYDATKGKLLQYNLIYSADLSSESRFEINYNKIINMGSTLKFGLVVNFPFLKSWSTFSDNSLFTNLYGAVAYDMDINNYSFYNRSQIGKSVVLCRLFIDKNGNNKFDDGEMMVNDASITLETPCSMEKISEGIIKIRELNPYTTYILKVDDNVKNPFLFPVFKTIAFQTIPNSSRIIDVPFYEGNEVYGSVILILKDNSKKLLNGINVIFENLSDNTKLKATTFSDGTFYLLGVKPVKYKIYIDPEQMDLLNCASDPEFFIYEFNNYDSSGRDFNFELRIKK